MKRSISILALVFLFVSLLMIEHAFAGAWTVPKYKVWGEVYQKWNYATRGFNSDWQSEKLTNGTKNWEYVMEPKLEYGVTDWLNALFSIEYKEGRCKQYDRPAAWGSFTRKNNAVTNIKIGGKLRFLDTPVILSTQTRVFINPGYGIDHGDDRFANSNQPGLGKGDDAVEQRILAGKTFNIPFTEKFKIPFYAGAETGYRWRTRHVCNDIPYFVEGGFWVRPWLLIKSELDGYKHHGGTGSIKESYGIWRAGCVWQVFGDSTLREDNKMFNLEFQYGRTVWGKNTNDVQELVLKVQSQF